MTDNFNTANDPQIDFDEFSETRTTQEIYTAGIEALRASGFILERDLFGEFLHHNIFVIEKPISIPGVNYPAGFRVKRPIYTSDHIDEIQSIIMSHASNDETFGQFWNYLVTPDISRRKPPYGHVRQLIAADNKTHEINPTLPFDLGISYDCEVGNKAPKSWVPKREWFDPALHDVTLADVLTIFPESERELLGLIIGRTVVGRSNHLPVNHTEPLLHTSRMAAAIIGVDPGTGKSTTFNQLHSATGKCGYVRSTFRSLSDRFNLGQTVSSHLAYKDDVSMDSFKKFLASENAKIIVTGGLMRVEQKGIDATDVYAQCTLIVNSNVYDPRVAFNLDPGTADRIKFISTKSAEEIKNAVPTGVSEGSPDIRPFSHIPFLADKLGVSEDAIMLWAVRLCADNFLELVDNKGDYSVNHLEERVRQLSNRCRINISKDTTRQVFLWMVLCLALYTGTTTPPRGHSADFPRDSIGTTDLVRMFTATVKVSKNKALMLYLRDLLKEDWEAKNYPHAHPYPGLKILDPITISDAINRNIKLTQPGLTNSKGEIYRETFKAIHLKNGFNLSCDYVWLVQEWEYAHRSFNAIHRMAENIIENRDDLLDSLWEDK